MNPPSADRYFIELLNHHGDLQARHELSALPIRIGRSYSNDIILDDPHVAPEHAVILSDENGSFIIRDLHSRNGVKMNGKRAQEFAIEGDSVYRLGHTQLRIRTHDYQVAAEMTDATHRHWRGWQQAFIAIGIIFLIIISNTWLDDVEESKSTTYITNMCLGLGMAALWAGIWALANRVFGGTAHFNRHLLVLSLGLVALQLYSYIAPWLAYGFSWELFTRYGSHVQIALFIALLYYHLRLINPQKHRHLKVICVALALCGSSLMLMKNQQSSSQYADELYMQEILPPFVRMSENHSLSEFNESITRLKIQIEAERNKTLNEKKKNAG